MLAALSCGAALPVSGLDILHITDGDADPVVPALTDDLNRAHLLLKQSGQDILFPSSFRYESCRPVLPSLRALSADPASAALLEALRGKGIPLSYKTDREAAEWAFSALLSDTGNGTLSPFRGWIGRISGSLEAGGEPRVSLLCDLGDPFSSGAAFALLRYLHDTAGVPSRLISLFCFAGKSTSADQDSAAFSSALRALSDQKLVAAPGKEEPCCADSVWLLAMPSSLVRTDESLRILYAAFARVLARFHAGKKLPAPGLHTADLPGILTLASLDDRAKPFAAFLQASAWLLSDLFPALTAYFAHPGALRSLSPNSRNGLFKRLFRQRTVPEDLPVVQRAIKALLSECLALIRFLPDPLRLAEVSDPLWQEAVAACGKTVTVASEYDVLLEETEEAGILNVKPVHRVSLADTEEELQLRRLEDIATQLRDETSARSDVFKKLGGARSWLVLRDCRTRCADALDRAEKQYEETSRDPDVAHLTLASQARRVRLLKAAVSRCDRDLADRELLRQLSAPVTDALPGTSPFAGQLLSPQAAEKLFSLLTAEEASAESVRKDLRALLPSLLYGFTLSDAKTLLRQLLSACKTETELPPFSVLLSAVLTVCREEMAPLHFVSAGEVPPVPLLADLCPARTPVSVASLLPLLPDPAPGTTASDGEKRGLLATLILSQYRRRSAEDPSLSLAEYSAGDSPVLKSWLAGRRSGSVWILSFGKDESSLPFALLLPGIDLLPARLTASHHSLLPSFAAAWYSADNSAFSDPVSLLGEGDRAILLEQLARVSGDGAAALSPDLKRLLSDFREDLLQEEKSEKLPDSLGLRLRAAFGLRLLPAFGQILVRRAFHYEHFLADDRVLSRMAGLPSVPPSACGVPDDIVYFYRDVPFARENTRTLLQGIPLPAESWILSLLEQECDTLSRASDSYHDALVREISLLLERCPDALPEARETAMNVLDRAGRPVSDTVTKLTWPWDPQSPSIKTILSESLGDSLAAAAVQPFSDRLALFPARGNEVIGDSLMSSMCVLPADAAPAGEGEEAPAFLPDAVLPPLSPELCAALCRLPEGRTLFRSGLLDFERVAEGGVRVTLSLEGSFPVRLVRVYPEEEVCHFYAHDIPTLAVWPSLPMAPEDWHAYFVYASLPALFSLSVFTADPESTASLDQEGRNVSCRAAFPLSFSFFRDGFSAGSLPNLLPAPEILKEEDVTACIDFGSVGTSVVLSAGHRRRPLQGPTMVRTLLNNPASSRELLRREFLPAVPVSALLPTASRIFRNVPGASPLPFEDGIVLMSSDLQDVLSIPSGALYSCLKWEEEKGRSSALCLHQIMLMTALQARSDGAATLSWRFAIPDEMAKAGREKLADLFRSLSDTVLAESGFPAPENRPAVTFAPESSAEGAYFRFCASEDTRGGFMVLDLGACTADISLFLRGREQAARTCQIPLGVHYILLPALLRDPSLLRRELGFIEDPVFQQDLSLLERILHSAKSDPASLRKARLALDIFIADRYTAILPLLLYSPATGMPSRLGSVLLLHFSYLMMLSGLVLLQIAADPGKNDFLPEQMSLCLSGRGAILMEALPDQVKTSLWHFLTMFRNRRVASLSLLFSSEKKMEVPVGLSVLQDVGPDLPSASAVPAAIPVRPEELLPQFLLRFRKEFPASAEILFSGFFTNDFYHPFSDYGESIVSSAIAQSFTERLALRPFDALSAWISCLMDLAGAAT